jgi:hypothetical protein
MADILQGTSSGSWGKAEKGPNPNPKLYPKDPSDTFRWGEPVDKSLEPNGLVFTGGTFTQEIGKEFEVGKLNYFNGSIFVDTAVESVPLQIELDLDSPTDETQKFTFDLDLDTTEDTSTDLAAWSDFVYFPGVVPTQTFNYEGQKYTLELTGFSKDGGKTLENRFRVMEQEGDVASLFGKITKAPSLAAGDVLRDPTGNADGAVSIGDLNGLKKGYRSNSEIGFTEGGVRDLQDFYKFTLSKESEVDVTLDQLKANANVEILDVDGSTVLFQSMEANRTRENITENLEPGTYFVRVYPEGDDRTKYRLGVSADALTDEKDKIATAKELGNIGLEEVTELDDIGLGRGRNRDSQDYYKFSLSEKSEFFLTLDQLKANANVEVLDSDGSTVLYQSVNSGRKAERIKEDLNAGDYYVRVTPQGSAKTDYRLGLSADIIAVENDDKEPGADLGAVTELTPVLVGDNLGRNRDKVDWYNFTLPVESDVNLTLDRLRADLNVEIYDDGGELVGEGKNSGRKAEKIELEEQEAGTYTVKVSPKGAAKSNYRLGITAANPYVDDYPTPEAALDFGTVAIGDKKVFNNEMGVTVGRSGRDERDWIRFDVDKESFVDISLGRLRQDINMILYDGDGASILNDNADKKGRANENLGVGLDEGTYYVEVLPKGNARSDYRFTVTAESMKGPVQKIEVGSLQSYEGGLYSQLGERIGFTSSGVRNVIDRYSFSVSEDSTVDIDLTGLRGDANIVLYESDGSFLFDSRSSGRRNENISQELEAGDYYVDVEPQNAAKTKYNLDIFAAPEIDPDGGPVPGSSLYNNIGVLTEGYSKFDSVGFGSGSSRDERDYYGFTLNEEKTLDIALTKLSDNINLELLDSTGSVIGFSRKKGKNNEKIEADLDPGDYYVRVEPQNSARGFYTLDISPEEGDGVDPDGGKPPENVNDIGVLTTYEEKDSIGRQEGGYRDVNDYRKFTLTEQSEVNINLTELTANADLELIDSDGRTLLSRSATDGNSDETINTTLAKGDYYARVLPKGAASTNYNLNMNAVIEPIDNDPPGVPLGTVGDPLTEGGLVGFGDINDYYNFDVGFPAFVNINLDGLSGNANLELYDSSGEVLIASSTNPGSAGEEIQTFLNNDNYVVRVFGQGSQTPYDLTVSV